MQEEIEGEENKLLTMSREELIKECERREQVAHRMWNAITRYYGPEGFKNVLSYLELTKRA